MYRNLPMKKTIIVLSFIFSYILVNIADAQEKSGLNKPASIGGLAQVTKCAAVAKNPPGMSAEGQPIMKFTIGKTSLVKVLQDGTEISLIEDRNRIGIDIKDGKNFLSGPNDVYNNPDEYTCCKRVKYSITHIKKGFVCAEPAGSSKQTIRLTGGNTGGNVQK